MHDSPQSGNGGNLYGRVEAFSVHYYIHSLPLILDFIVLVTSFLAPFTVLPTT